MSIKYKNRAYDLTHIGTYRYKCQKIGDGFPVSTNGNYESLLSFKELPPYKEFKLNGRKWIFTKNYYPVMDRIVLDIDCPGGLEKAFTVTKSIMQDLADYSDCINVYFSGSKGFHIEILTAELDIVDKTANKPKDSCNQYVNFLNYFMDKYSDVDLSLKDVGTRIIRKAHTKHEKTGNYKVLIDINASLDTILDHSHKNIDMVLPKTAMLSQDQAFNLLNTYSKQVNIETELPPVETEIMDSSIFITVYNELNTNIHNKILLLASGLNGFIDKKEAESIYTLLANNTDIEDSTNAKGSFMEAYENDKMPCNLGALRNHYTSNNMDLTNFDKLSLYMESKLPSLQNGKGLSYTGVYDFYSDGVHYKQQNKKISQIREKEITLADGTTKKKKYPVPKAIFSIDRLVRYTDVLDLSEPLYTLVYYHGYDERLKTIEKQSKEAILKQLVKEDLFNTTYKDSEKIFRTIRHSLHSMDLMEKQQTIIHKGFFIDDGGKLISNTNIDGLSTSSSDLKEAMLLLIELLDSNIHSKHKNATVLRKLLAMPFNYCIKQLGFAEDNTNGLILYGKAKTGKTALCKIGLWFYLEEPYNYNASTDTLSSLVRVLNSTTFYTLLDDSYGLLKNESVQNTIKKGMYESFSRTVSDKDSKDVLEYKALSTPVFTYNEHIPIIDDGLERRLDKIQYDKNNVISREDSIDFKMKYNPLTKHSVLEKLHHIGIAFKEWIKPYLESSNKELNDMDTLTRKFFKETLAELGLEYDPLISNYDYETTIEYYGHIIRSHFNKKLLRSKIISSNGVSIGNLMNIADSGYFNWLCYQPKNNQFVINADLFLSECNKITNHSFSFEDLMSELEITDFEVKQIKVNGKPIPKATKIRESDLIHNILNINALLYEREAEYVSPPD